MTADDRRRDIALFRMGVLGDIAHVELRRGKLRRALKEKSETLWCCPDGKSRRFAAKTIQTWLYAYKRRGGSQSGLGYSAIPTATEPADPSPSPLSYGTRIGASATRKPHEEWERPGLPPTRAAERQRRASQAKQPPRWTRK